MRRLFAAAFFLGVALFGNAVQAAAPTIEDSARQIWQLLDYLAVDYAGAVKDGKVIAADEYAEMREFAQTAGQQLAGLPDKPGKAALLEQAASLKGAIAAKAAAGEVGGQARQLAAALLAAYPVPVAPSNAPSLERGLALYQAQCASCHGATGHGDGPLASQLTPPPVAFSHRDRARERSLFALHQTISRGVPGTSMPAFATLSDDERWALSFFVSTLAFSDQEREAGAALWKSDAKVRAALPSLAALTQASESTLAAAIPAQQAAQVLAYLRSNPASLSQSNGAGLALSSARLRESLAALEKGDRANASRLALSAYLDGFEPVEPTLAVRDNALFTAIEKNMGAYRAAVTSGDAAQARSTEQALQAQLVQAEDAISNAGNDPMGVFVGALTILLREGAEALLVVVAMIAFLKKAGRQDVLPMVHAGWMSALVAGGLTWFAATYMVEISGASRELTEGYSSLFAAVILLSVGIWMHQKSMAGRWQAYIRDKLSAALGRQSAVMLFVLAFVTVYREVFETVLFYAALWTEGTGAYLLAGLGLGIVLLGLVAWIMLRTSTRLPIGRFFAISSGLVAVLAVVLVGKGVAALQEAGVLGITPIAGPSLDLLGIHPSLQTTLAQLAVVGVIAVSMLYNARSARGLRAV
ncbi:MAG: iron permease [Burkholderia sp.]|nr:iron permease [Burkholderia sp.]